MPGNCSPRGNRAEVQFLFLQVLIGFYACFSGTGVKYIGLPDMHFRVDK
ncbi:MAG TPA: hypothetical protein VFB79_20720 [Candidatus Angelobacter sp.]|nr:hypothetical protein [Candidatus Angelobacter sp.]